MTTCIARVTRDQRCGVELRLIERDGLRWWGHLGPHARHYPRPAPQGAADTLEQRSARRPLPPTPATR